MSRATRSDRRSRLLAFDRKTGELKLGEEAARRRLQPQHAGARARSAASRSCWSAAANALQGLDPHDRQGALVVRAPHGRHGLAGLGGGLVYCDSGRGGPGVAVDPTGTGDVTQDPPQMDASPQVPEGFSSPVIVGDYLYRLHSPAC